MEKFTEDSLLQAFAAGIAYLFLLVAALLPCREGWAFSLTICAIGMLTLGMIGRFVYLLFVRKREPSGKTYSLENPPAKQALRMAAYFLLLLAILGPETDGVQALYVLLGISLLCAVLALVAGRWKKD